MIPIEPLMKCFFFVTLMAIGWCPLSAQQKLPILGETALNWPCIQCQIYSIQHIAGDRLLVGIRLKATADAVAGTLIGYPVPIPPGAKDYDLVYYQPRPFSLASSVMVDDLTHQKYPTLLPAPAPAGVAYFPDSVMEYIRPGQNIILGVQFACPPPPSAPPGQPEPKQTVSFLFTNAKDSIKNIPIPPSNP